MFDDEDLLVPPDHLDCLLEVYSLKEEARSLSNETLVNSLIEIGQDIKKDFDAETAITKYFNIGTLTPNDRNTLEDCYVLLKNFLCIDVEDGEICATQILGS